MIGAALLIAVIGLVVWVMLGDDGYTEPGEEY